MSRKSRRYFTRLRKALPKLKLHWDEIKTTGAKFEPDAYPIQKEIEEIEAILERQRTGIWA